jgi:hypothetical protein
MWHNRRPQNANGHINHVAVVQDLRRRKATQRHRTDAVAKTTVFATTELLFFVWPILTKLVLRSLLILISRESRLLPVVPRGRCH